MQTQQAISAKDFRGKQNISPGGAIGSLVARVFGCWHREMSRPFSSQGQSYRTCLNCGASRKFNVGRWEMQGNFYYARPNVGSFGTLSSVAAR
ncbi:MAG TPA: hypothetical protein VGO56_19150 [Pyrinomonadaceae bacterium]|nr:hypothetical protein [Pyrinomonadaceae bacterium]